MGRPRNYDALAPKIVELYAQLNSGNAVARELGLSHGTVYRLLRESGVWLPKSDSPESRERKRRLRGEEASEVVSAFTGGESIQDIARRMQIGVHVIYSAIDAAGIPRRRRGRNKVSFSEKKKSDDLLLSPELRAEIADCYRSGSTLRQVQQTFSISQNTVYKILRDQRVEPRKRGQYFDLTEEEKDAVVARWNNGDALWTIARAFKSSEPMLSRVLEERGLTPERRPQRGSRHSNWKGGRLAHKDGYVSVRLDEDHLLSCMRQGGGYVLEHRLVMAEHVGRPLRRNESVHHINGNRSDNRIENLQLRIGKSHGSGQVWRCNCCGSYDVSPTLIGD